jgi:hypothetical protein
MAVPANNLTRQALVFTLHSVRMQMQFHWRNPSNLTDAGWRQQVVDAANRMWKTVGGALSMDLTLEQFHARILTLPTYPSFTNSAQETPNGSVAEPAYHSGAYIQCTIQAVKSVGTRAAQNSMKIPGPAKTSVFRNMYSKQFLEALEFRLRQEMILGFDADDNYPTFERPYYVAAWRTPDLVYHFSQVDGIRLSGPVKTLGSRFARA